MKATIKIDEEIMGNRIECDSTEKLIKEVVRELDENVYEISIKKRAVKDNSPSIPRTE